MRRIVLVLGLLLGLAVRSWGSTISMNLGTIDVGTWSTPNPIDISVLTGLTADGSEANVQLSWTGSNIVRGDDELCSFLLLEMTGSGGGGFDLGSGRAWFMGGPGPESVIADGDYGNTFTYEYPVVEASVNNPVGMEWDIRLPRFDGVGTFTVSDAQLYIESREIPPPVVGVPEAGTLAGVLGGILLVGMLAMRERRR